MKKTYEIEVDCANCANKMEVASGKVAGVESVSIHYMAQKMTVEFAAGADPDAVIQDIIKVCRKVERDFEIYL